LKQKKYSILLAIFLLNFNVLLFTQTEATPLSVNDEYTLDFIDPRFIGAYLPVDFITALKKTKHYANAMKINKHDYYYTELIVNNNNVISIYPFEDTDSYISKSQFLKFQFMHNRNETLIKDPQGCKFLKITNDLENHMKIMSNYIGKIILNDLIKNGDITIDSDTIFIPSLNTRFEIGTLKYAYNNNENLVLKEYDKEKYYSLEIVNNLYTIYWIENNYYTSYKDVKRVIWEKKL
jgi:hypothetical protein